MNENAAPILIIFEFLIMCVLSRTWNPIASLFSIQLRLLAYTFLRWIPGRHGPTLVPLVFLLWLISSWERSPRQSIKSIQAIKTDDQPKAILEKDQSSSSLVPTTDASELNLSTHLSDHLHTTSGILIPSSSTQSGLSLSKSVDVSD